MLPPTEIDQTIVMAMEGGDVMGMQECAGEVVQRFGYKSPSAQMRTPVEERIRRLLADGAIIGVQDDRAISE